jgi:hypothetical protein
MTTLFSLADLFLTKITSSIEFFPYGLRWINKHIKRALKEKFKNATDAEIMPILGYLFFFLSFFLTQPDKHHSHLILIFGFFFSYLVYHRFIQPAIVAPDDFEMADNVTPQQRINLIAVCLFRTSLLIL